MSKFKVVLTGGIASGKTHVSDMFHSQGAHVIDADLLAREVVKKDSDGLQQVVSAFGTEVLNSDGTLNRGELKQLVFSDKQKLKELNNILHPLIRTACLSSSEKNLKNIELWVIPLLRPKSGYTNFDRVLVLDVNQEVQIKRILQRDSVDVKTARSIIQSQPSRSERLRMATDVITNNKGFDEFNSAIQSISQLIKLMSNSEFSINVIK